MRIQRIRAKNYRTLQDIQVDFAPAYCTLSGRNNAGKSCIIRLLLNILGDPQSRPWHDDHALDYKEDVTQWAKGNPSIEFQCSLRISHADDPALLSFVEKVARREI